MKKLALWSLFFGLICSCYAFGNETILWEHPTSHHLDRRNGETVIDWAKENLPQRGRLMQAPDGYIYLKVDDDYIDQLYPMLSEKGYIKPPYFRRSDSPGAHISVFYTKEREQTGKIKEVGRYYPFTLSFLSFVPEKSHEYIVIVVNAPELEDLRQKYGLSPLLQGNDFHITIAKKKFKRINTR